MVSTPKILVSFVAKMKEVLRTTASHACTLMKELKQLVVVVEQVGQLVLVVLVLVVLVQLLVRPFVQVSILVLVQ